MNTTITNSFLTAVINPQGAELISLRTTSREYIWEGNPEFWGKHSPVLFPIVGTLKGNTYNYNSGSYNLSRHGFARDNRFSVKEHDTRSVTFLLASNKHTKEVYPFDFDLELNYTLKQNQLHITYLIRNKGRQTMPFSIGAHPAFALPGKFEEYSLRFEHAENLESSQLESDLISDNTVAISLQDKQLPLSYELFENDALIFKNLNSDRIAIEYNGEEFLAVAYQDFPHMGIWTKPGAPFICIEPWHGYSDAHNSNGDIMDKEGIILLEAEEEFSAGFVIEITL